MIHVLECRQRVDLENLEKCPFCNDFLAFKDDENYYMYQCGLRLTLNFHEGWWASIHEECRPTPYMWNSIQDLSLGAYNV